MITQGKCGKDHLEYHCKTAGREILQGVSNQVQPICGHKIQKVREARNAKRKILQSIPENRKASAKALTKHEIVQMARLWNEEKPEGIQKKFYHIAAFEFAWRGEEAESCKISYFKEDLGNDGKKTGRIQYTPIFTETVQGGAQKLADSKWLTSNNAEQDICPVRFFRKIVKKRGDHVTSDRLFLTPNPFWTKTNSKRWSKNSPIGPSASNIGLNIKRAKITNIQIEQRL